MTNKEQHDRADAVQPSLILVIEDEDEVRANIVDLLELEGFAVLDAHDGELGLQLAMEQLPDLILCDVMMAGLDGYDVLARLQQQPTTAQIPLIFLTARATKADFRQGMVLGADDYLTKPFTRHELIEAIAAQLAKRAIRSPSDPSRHTPLPVANPDQMAVVEQLKRAIAQNEFLLHYQPQVDLRTGQVTGAEALVRWHNPERGLVPPAEFIPLAEETGLIQQIGDWVLKTACEQICRWQLAGFSMLRMAVNLSGKQFDQTHLSQRITQVLRTTGLDPTCLELEVTESFLVENAEAAIATLTQLKAIGVQIAIDDFGTGYSSLSYLQQFPFNVLKIDRCFVRNLPDEPRNQAIVTAVIQMAHNLNLQVIAEGVETESELAFLHHHCCNAIQGYLFSRPLPAAEFEALLTNGRRLTRTPYAQAC